MTKKIFAMFLAVLMVVSMLPTSVFAADATCPGKGAAHTVDNCTYEEKGTVAPTCKDAGYTVYQCSKCGDTFVGNFNYELAEHTYEPAEDQAPTCSEPGYKGGLKCSVCGHLTGAEEVPALGEGVSCLFGDWDVTVFDCTKNFTATRFCVNCNAKDEVKYEVAKDYKGHVMGDWVKGENGVITRACTVTFTANGFTWKCSHTESSTALPTHPHTADTTLLFVAEVAAKCEKTGTAAHYVCRECGELFGEDLKATTAEDLVIASLHDQLKEELNCMTTTKPCGECGEYIFVGSAPHKFTPWVVTTEPTCVNAGLRERVCTVCGIAKETDIMNPLGHATYSQTIEATCSMYKYTFTYCVRPGCTNKVETAVIKDKVSYDVTLGENVLTAPIVGLEFYMNLFQGNAKVNKELFFNGTLVDNKYLGTTEKKEEAVQVKLVNALDKNGFVIEGAYWMTFVDANGATKYIDLYEYTTGKLALTIADASVNYFTWNETYKTLTCTVKMSNNKTEERFLGTYNEYKTISCSNVSYLEGTSPQYVAKMTTYNTNGVKLMANGLTVVKGYAEDKHELKDLVYSAPTCQFEGTRIQYCVDCGTQLPAEVLPVVDHKWIADTTKQDKAATCTTEGKKNLICEYPGCGETKVETIPAKGHTLETEKKNGKDVVKVYTHTGHHADLLAYQYNLCKDENCPIENKRVIIDGTQKAWDGATKIFKDLTEAKAAHPECDLTATPALDVKGTCFKVGYKAYSCSGCTNTVRVKEPGSGEHEAAPKSNEADCLNAGGYITYICSKCETKVGEGTVGETFNKTADALGHKMKKNNKYVASTCENPNLDEKTNYAEYCERCDHKVHDYAYTGNVKVLDESKGETLCTAEIWTEISCKEHGVHTINHIGNYGHSYIQDPNNKNVKPTCTTTGTNYFVCEYCNAPKTETVAKTNHKDADGEFSELCLTKDRHCDLCCKANGCDKLEDHDCFNPDGDKKTDDACSCVKKADQHDYKTQYTGSTCEQYPTKATICTLCHKSKDVVQYTEYNKAPIVLGHKPVAAKLDANGEVIKYMGYTYKTVTYVSYIWVGEVLTPAAETYVAEYKEYTEATLTEGGKIVFECATCKQTITEGTDAINALQFSAEVRGEEFTYGSLVAVDLYVNGIEKELYGFNFAVNFTGMTFVGAEKTTLGSTFVCQTTPAAQVTNTVNVGGYVAGSTKNVTVNEKTLLTTLYFRVDSYTAAVAVDHIDADTTVSKYMGVEKGKVKYEYFTATMAKPEEIKVAAYMDLDRNGSINFNDILVGVQILNMELEYDYDVAGDVDYDGVFTVADLTTMMDIYLATDMELAAYEVLIEAVGADHAKLMGLLETCTTCKAVYPFYENHTCPKV